MSNEILAEKKNIELDRQGSLYATVYLDWILSYGTQFWSDLAFYLVALYPGLGFLFPFLLIYPLFLLLILILNSYISHVSVISYVSSGCDGKGKDCFWIGQD